MFQFMPIMFTFMLAPFPAGLVIYWTWSNTLSIAQQYVIMRRARRADRHKVGRRCGDARSRPDVARRGGGAAETERRSARDAGRDRGGAQALRRPVRLHAGRRVDRRRCRRSRLPEVAFAGRSNVGKSSLINALTGRARWPAPRTSPAARGRSTSSISAAGSLLVDLPGYGFAQASQTSMKDPAGLAAAYLRGRPTLKRVCLLIDARHGVKDSRPRDHGEPRRGRGVLPGRADQGRRAEGRRVPRAVAAAEAVARKHGAAHPAVLPTSSENGSASRAPDGDHRGRARLTL